MKIFLKITFALFATICFSSCEKEEMAQLEKILAESEASAEKLQTLREKLNEIQIEVTDEVNMILIPAGKFLKVQDNFRTKKSL